MLPGMLVPLLTTYWEYILRTVGKELHVKYV